MHHLSTRPSRAAAATFARRATVLLSLLAVIGLVPAWPAMGTPPDATLRSVVVDDWLPETPGLRTMEAGTWRTSDPIDATDVVMAGADWGGDESVEVQLRSAVDGTWSEWTELHLDPDHGPDPGSAEQARAGSPTLSDPVWTGPVDQVQFRVQGPAARLTASMVAVSGGDGLAWTPRQSPRAAAFAQPAKPDIISRETWGADESLRNFTPVYAEDVRFSVVHHTADQRGSAVCTAESEQTYDDWVRAEYVFHTQGRGWDDLAYNFAVDPCGNVYEGRSGGVEKAVIGAHAAGWNGGSTGVVVLGNFENTVPTNQAKEALPRLLAWKLDVHHVDPHGTTEELAGGGTTNRYDRNDRVTLPTIIGHRDTNSTACPGSTLYDWMFPSSGTTIRDRVAAIGAPKAYGGPPAEQEQPVTGTRPRWDVTFTEPLDWRLVIRDEDGAFVRSTGGTGDEEVHLAWDLRDADGNEVPPGTYTSELTSWSLTRTATPITTTFEVRPAASRMSGQDRVGTALELSRWAFDSASRVVIATSRSYADALAATPLAGSFGAPILLTPPGGLPDDVAEEIKRLHADEAWIVGGEAAVSGQVVRDLQDKAGIAADGIHRRAGSDRFSTAYAVADEVLHREDSTEVLVAVGRSSEESRAFPDALSAGGLGAEFDLPIVLVEPHRLPGPTRQFLDEHDLSDGVQLFGGTAAISSGVETAIRDAARVEVRRFAGSDRYDTARLAAEETLRRWAEFEQEIGGRSPYLEGEGLEVVVASGANWPDALGAGAAADERRRSVFLLTPPEELDLSGATARFIGTRSDDITHVVVSGGAGAVSDQVRDDLDRLVRLDGPHTADPEPWPEDPHAPPPPALPLPGPTGSPSPSPSPTAS